MSKKYDRFDVQNKKTLVDKKKFEWKNFFNETYVEN